MSDLCSMDYTDRLVFLAEWFDNERAHIKHFYLHYYPFDNSVELYDKDINRVYLRRALCEGLSLKDMFVGNTIRVYGRQIDITDYGDMRTKILIAKKTEKTLAVFKPNVLKHIGTILSTIIHKKLKVVKLRMCELTRSQALEFYEDKKSDAFLPFMIEKIISGPIIAAELIGENAIVKWKELVGPKDPAVARNEAPDSLRAIYGLELASNGFHAPDDEAQYIKESNYFFPKPSERRKAAGTTTAQVKHGTCCVIKPHAIDAGQLGEIVFEIMNNGFKIIAMEMFYLSNANADEFLEVYKGIVSDFNALMLSFVDGPCAAIQIDGNENSDVHGDFRKFCGPCDPDVARQIRPNTLRARFGINRYKNAVHCTDLPEDTTLELEYFFQIHQN